MLDALEPRRHFAATLASARLDAATGKVILVGSADGDAVELRRSGKTQAQVVDGGQVVLTFDLAAAKRGVTFSGGDGADTLIMGRTPLRLYAEGGNGDDAFSAARGGLFANHLLGGPGDDYLFAGTGNTTLDGGLGNDTMLGFDGADTFYALSDNAGDDVILGGRGGYDVLSFGQYAHGVTLRIGDSSPAPLAVDDRILGGIETVLATRYDDTVGNVSGRPVAVMLEGGNDSFQGGRAPETVDGGPGSDTIRTAGGDDTIVDTEDTNYINGGGGTDTATYRNSNIDVIDLVESLIDLDPNNAG